MDLSFDGRVAIITGAGRGLGRGYAEALAARGAAVVVNDPGVSLEGAGDDPRPACEVVQTIVERGGRAIASFDRVGTEVSAASLIAQTIDRFGRVDIVINNAGNFMPARTFLETSTASFEAVLQTHLYGSLHIIRAAWPLMAEQGYGKILNVASHVGYVGTRNRLEYGTAKAALHGLTRCLSHESVDEGIFVNIIAPAALTRPVAASLDMGQAAAQAFAVDLVTPLALWLVHESCRANGEAFSAMAGTFTQIKVAETDGIWCATPSPEFIRDNFRRLCDDKDGLVFPVDGESRGSELVARFLSRMDSAS